MATGSTYPPLKIHQSACNSKVLQYGSRHPNMLPRQSVQCAGCNNAVPGCVAPVQPCPNTLDTRVGSEGHSNSTSGPIACVLRGAPFQPGDNPVHSPPEFLGGSSRGRRQTTASLRERRSCTRGPLVSGIPTGVSHRGSRPLSAGIVGVQPFCKAAAAAGPYSSDVPN